MNIAEQDVDSIGFNYAIEAETKLTLEKLTDNLFSLKIYHTFSNLCVNSNLATKLLYLNFENEEGNIVYEMNINQHPFHNLPIKIFRDYYQKTGFIIEKTYASDNENNGMHEVKHLLETIDKYKNQDYITVFLFLDDGEKLPFLGGEYDDFCDESDDY